jgi:hypothetical protein
MADLNRIASDITNARQRILKEMGDLLSMYRELDSSITSRFNTEYRANDGSLTGLEDFYILKNIVRKNNVAVKNAHAILSRMQDVAGFDISEEAIVDKELEKILNA